MNIVLNNRATVSNFSQALRDLAAGADTLSLAVSYLKVSGYHLFKAHTPGINLPKMRIVCTDQMNITQPAAVKLFQSDGVKVHNYSGTSTYHPKVYLAHNREGKPTRFLLGSANLSRPAFTNSIEAGVLSDDSAGLRSLNDWFKSVFTERSDLISPAKLLDMEARWKVAASGRSLARLADRRNRPATDPDEMTDEDLDTVDDIFSTIRLPIGLLNMDYAGNNIRNVSRVREVLGNWARVRTSAEGRHSKQRSELKLLGFARPPSLTTLGEAAAAATSDEAVARLWCAWLQETPNAALAEVNTRLLVAKRVFSQFWRLQREVRDYFLAHAENPNEQEKSKLQVIELLCNASPVVESFSLADFEALAPLLNNPARLPEFVGVAVSEYRDNKGARSWGPDRRVIAQAWRDASA